MSATSDNLALARRTILAPGGLDEGRLDRTLGLVMDHAVDAADLYFQVSREESWALEDGIVKEGSASIEEGVGVRAISGEKTGFAYSDEIHLDALEEASRAARAIASQAPGKGVQAWQRVDTPLLYQPADPLSSLDDAVKVEWLMRVDRETRAMDPRVKQVNASCHAVHEVVLVANNSGQLAADVRPLVRFNVSVIVEQGLGINGIGQNFIGAVQQRDYPLVQGILLVIITTTLVVNLLVDLSYSFLDPRIKY